MLLSATGYLLNLRLDFMSTSDSIHDIILLQREGLQSFY